MAVFGNRLLHRTARPLGWALAVLWATPAAAAGIDLFSGDTLELNGDLRLVAADGEKGWLERGFGKLRTGSDGDLRVRPELGNVNLIWQPRFSWSLSATVVGSLQGGERTEAGLSQAYLSYKPMRGSKPAVSARAGLMFPPVSLEHDGADWHVRDSITPSAINSWIGEEVRPVAAEATIAADAGAHKVRATAAIMAANDTAGTLLTLRGWALHDRTTLAFHRQPLPPLGEDIAQYQAPFTHPLIDLHGGFAHRPGYYAKLSWQPPVPVRVELFRYDNRADPEVVNDDLEWGWRTRFNHLAVAADLGRETELKAQAIQGTTRMGYREDDRRRWVDNRFRSAFAMLVHSFGEVGVALRAEAFDTRNRGSDVDKDYDDRGWSAMLAAKREWGRFTGLVEILHVSSCDEEREEHGLDPRQHQTQFQADLRIRW